MRNGQYEMSDSRLPDAAFFQQAEDNGHTLVQIRYCRQGGNKSYYIVRNAAELAELVCGLPEQSAVEILAIGNHLPWDDRVYTQDHMDECKPGAY